MAGDPQSKRPLGRGLLAVTLAAVALWACGSACTGTVAFLVAWAGAVQRPSARGLVVLHAGRPGAKSSSSNANADAKSQKAAAVSYMKKYKGHAGRDDKIPVQTGPVLYQGKPVANLNGTLPEWKVDIWSGAHPVWQGKFSKVSLDTSSLTTFQTKFGALSDIFGEAGLDKLEENERMKAEMEARKKQGLKVY